jgi:hypothetical protein
MFNDFFYGRAYCFALRCAGADATSLSFHKEVAKKGNPDVPSGASPALPHCKVKDEI